MFCYRFPDVAAWLGAAFAEGLIVDGELQAYTHDHAIDVIGAITKPGTYDENGDELTPPVLLPGFHVNVVGIAPESWDSFLVVVNSPSRIFAGGGGAVPDEETLAEIEALP